MTRADILRVAKQYIDPAKFVIVAVGNPKDFGTPLSSLGLPVTNLDITIPSPVKAQLTPQPKGAALLAKMAQAMGGESNLASIKDLTQKAEIAAATLKASQTESWLATGQFREESVLPFGKLVIYSDGKTGWEANPKGVTPIPDPVRKQIGFELFRMWVPLLASAHDPDREIKDEANGTVRISDRSGDSVLLSIDPATGLPLSANYSLGETSPKPTPTGRKPTASSCRGKSTSPGMASISPISKSAASRSTRVLPPSN